MIGVFQALLQHTLTVLGCLKHATYMHPWYDWFAPAICTPDIIGVFEALLQHTPLILLKPNQILNKVDDRANCAAMSRFIFQALSVLSVFGLVNSVFYYFVDKESEGGRLQAEMLALKREVQDEKTCRSKAMAELQVELQERNFQVAQLEKSLRAKKVELEGVITKSNRESTHHKIDMKQAKKQVCKNNGGGGKGERGERGYGNVQIEQIGIVGLDLFGGKDRLIH